MHSNKMGRFQLSLPQYNAKLDSETISLSMDFISDNDQKIGEIEVVISFQDLIDHIGETNWWKSNTAYLIDNEGNILSATKPFEKKMEVASPNKFGEKNLLEIKTLEALKNNTSGTIFGEGHPPEEISGYYHLNEAPWSLVIISPGKKVLTSILNFRLYYFNLNKKSITKLMLILFLSCFFLNCKDQF